MTKPVTKLQLYFAYAKPVKFRAVPEVKFARRASEGQDINKRMPWSSLRHFLIRNEELGMRNDG